MAFIYSLQVAADRRLCAEIAAGIDDVIDSEFGPFADDVQGSQARTLACQLAYGKTPEALAGELLGRRA